MSDECSDAGEVGYGGPPKETRFVKRQSGNPSGKRKSTRSLRAELEKFFNTPIPVMESGRRRQLLPEVVAMKKLFSKAAGGDVQAMRLLFKIRHQYGGLDLVKLEHAQLDLSAAARKFDELCSRSDEPGDGR